MTASPAIQVRLIRQEDRAQWTPLWLGYNAFYGREGATALPQQITDVTWSRFFNPVEPVFAAVAEHEGRIVGLVHYLFHRSTTRIEPICYLQDLFTAEADRGRGVGRALILAVCDAARAQGCGRVYWQTHTTNAAGRALYDRLAEHKRFIVYGREL